MSGTIPSRSAPRNNVRKTPRKKSREGGASFSFGVGICHLQVYTAALLQVYIAAHIQACTAVFLQVCAAVLSQVCTAISLLTQVKR